MSFETFNPSQTDNKLRLIQNEDSGHYVSSGAVSIPTSSVNLAGHTTDQIQSSANTTYAVQTQNDGNKRQVVSAADSLGSANVEAGDGGDVAEDGYDDEETNDTGSRSMRVKADQTLIERVKKAPELMKQFEEYIRLLEDRICALEIDRVSSAVTKLTVPNHIDIPQEALLPNSTIRATPAIPDWIYMISEEYEKEKGRAVPTSHYAIDILIDKPSQIHQGGNDKSRARNIAGIVLETATSHTASPTIVGGLQDLPERIRINSNPAKSILDSYCNRGLRFLPGFPLVLQRPYKLLVYHETAIRNHLADLERKWGQRRSSTTAQDTVDSGNNDAKLLSSSPTLGISENRPNESNDQISTPGVPKSYAFGNGKLVSKQYSADQGVTKNLKEENQSQLPAGWGRQKDYFGRTYYVNHHTKIMTWTRPRSDIKILTPSEKQDSEEEAEFDPLLDSEEAMNDLRCVVRFMDEFIKPVRDQVQGPRQRSVRYSELWHLFKPGQLIYVRDRDIPQKVWRVVQVTGGRRYLRPPYPEELKNGMPPRKSRNNGYSDLVLDCYFLDYDGSRFAPSYNSFTISKYDDARLIDTLPVYPVTIAEEERTIDRAALMKRGQQYVRCTKTCHRYYSGRSLLRTGSGAYLSFRNDSESDRVQMLNSEVIEGEVMVDFDRAFHRHPEWLPIFHDLRPSPMDMREIEEDETDPFEEKVEQDDIWDRRRRDDFIDGDELKLQPWPKGIEPSGEDLLLLPDRVFGFVLRSRKWANLAIDLLRPIEPKTDGWDDLELPEGHKEIVQSLIKSHFAKDKSKSMDFARDKGKGLIILLHGAPGVGKTSTAECVAQSNCRPLLPITCGDLGLTARDVESKLDSAFQLAQAWDCVLLLDEADIFLAARTTTDLERNALVSVFLRVLEYYEGLLFLTTNRVGAFDEAFKSRIHMALYYPFLDRRQTISIWRTQLKRMKAERKKSLEVDDDKILDFANELFLRQQQPTSNGIRWNGRQIRNAYQSALAIAEFAVKDNTPARLEISHFEKVARASVEFEEYLWRVKSGRSDADIAAHNMMRADNYGADLVPSNSTHLVPKPAMGSQPAFRSRPKTPANPSYMPQNMQTMSQSQTYQMGQQAPQGYPTNGPMVVQYQQQAGGGGGGVGAPSYLQPTMNMNGYGPAQQQSMIPNNNLQQQPFMQQQGGRAQPGIQMQQVVGVGEGDRNPTLSQQQQHHPQMQNQSSQQQQQSFLPDNYQYPQQKFPE